ncbi:hypothetical protein Pmani_006066 [Petrolisthes manimaculis]|uniref:Uncharacterized protein n=1 Tax=Petrolisthes manimaculis TaxID=1843537 RepID=A0AAE1QBN4_9EUCA|nr:hypothetical protein Pmani_006066 [Petrolisthes manimaculis]
MAHLLGTPDWQEDAEPKPLTEFERERKLEREQKILGETTAPIYVAKVSTAPILYAQIPTTQILYKKVHFSPDMYPPQQMPYRRWQ